MQMSRWDIELRSLQEGKIEWDRFDERNIIGSGKFGTVYKGILPEKLKAPGHVRSWPRSEVALKVQKVSSLIYEQRRMEDEIRIGKKAKFPSLLRLLAASFDEIRGSLVLLTLRMRKTLEEMIELERRSLSPSWENSQGETVVWDSTRRAMCVFGVAAGLCFLHEDPKGPVVHRDLKPGNILIDEDMLPHISDFGLARILSVGDMTVGVGTPLYRAPEVCETGNYSTKCDVYSFGLIVYEMATTAAPFVGDMPVVTENELEARKKSSDLSIPESVPVFWRELIQNCTQRDPELRWDMREVVEKCSGDGLLSWGDCDADAFHAYATTLLQALERPRSKR